MKYPLASKTWEAEEYQAALKVLAGDHYSMGEYTLEFEKAYAKWSGSKYAIFCNSGSSANLLALSACLENPSFDINPGDEVIVPSVSWSTTYAPILQLGLKPVLADISLSTFNLSPDKVIEKISSKTKIIFAVNLLGVSCDFDALTQICKDNDLILLEDNCESMGAEYKGKLTGSFGLVSTHSTFFSHHMATMEGGICLTDDEMTFEILKSLRAHGWVRNVDNKELFFSVFDSPENDFHERFHFVMPGYNFRPTEISSAIGIEQLKRLDGFLENRRANAKYFQEKLNSHDCGLTLQKDSGLSSWFGFGLLSESEKQRKVILSKLNKNEIESRPIVSGNMARQPMFKQFQYSPDEFPNAEELHKKGFMIGNHQFDIRPMIDHFFDSL